MCLLVHVYKALCISRLPEMIGELFLYDEGKLLAAFETCLSADEPVVGSVIFVGGLTDGFLTAPCLPALAKRLAEKQITLTQFVMSSSYNQFGFNSLASDSQDLAKLIDFMANVRKRSKIFLLGHSTGCQDIFWFLQRDLRAEHPVFGANCHAPVSDRDFACFALPELVRGGLPVAEELIAIGKGSQLLPKMHEGCPMTAYRFHSLFGRLGDDDYFSSDLTLEECKAKFHILPEHPTMRSFNFSFSLDDEFVPEPRSLNITLLIEKLLSSFPFTRDPILLPGNHNFSTNLQSIEQFSLAIVDEVLLSFQ
jgi:hypothetical protein